MAFTASIFAKFNTVQHYVAISNTKYDPQSARNYGKGTNPLKLLSKTRHLVDLHETHVCSTPDNLPLIPKGPQFFVQLTFNPQYAVSVNSIQLRRTAHSLYVATSKPSLVQTAMMLGPVDTTTNK
jgi:hypothetical protein